MTINSPLTRGLINPSAPAAIQLLMRQSVTPLPHNSLFVANGTVLAAMGTSGSYFWLHHLAETRAP
jgi:hypothetical protein